MDIQQAKRVIQETTSYFNITRVTFVDRNPDLRPKPKPDACVVFAFWWALYQVLFFACPRARFYDEHESARMDKPFRARCEATGTPWHALINGVRSVD